MYQTMKKRIAFKKKNQLFSSEVVNRHDLYSFKLLNMPRSAKTVSYWLTGIFVGCILALFLPWQQNIRSNGYVTALNPEERPQTVNTVIGGIIEKWYVHEGQMVKKGDTLLKITEIKDKYFDPETPQRLQEQVRAKESAVNFIGGKVQALQNQLVALEEGLELSCEKAKNKILQARMKVNIDSAELVAIKVDYDIAVQRFKRYESMFDSGLISLTNYESRKLKVQEALAKVQAQENKLLVARNEYINTKIELNSTIADYHTKIAKGRSDLNEANYNQNDAQGSVAKLKNEAANVSIRNKFYVIRAPQDGKVVQALKAGIGETIKQGDAVVTIMPKKHTPAVELYVYPRDVPLLSVGRKVRLEFDGWPALQFSGWPSVAVGTFGGVVAVIDQVNSKGGKYRILVSQDPQEPQWPEQLRIGSGVYGWAMLDEVRVWFEIWRQLNGFPPSLREKPEDDEKDKKEKDTGSEGDAE